jgi:hypothetical protein
LRRVTSVPTTAKPLHVSSILTRASNLFVSQTLPITLVPLILA